MSDKRIKAAEEHEAPEIDGGSPVIGPRYYVKSTEEGLVISREPVDEDLA